MKDDWYAIMKFNLTVGIILFWLMLGSLYLLSVILNAEKYGRPIDLPEALILGTLFSYLFWAGMTVVLLRMIRAMPVPSGVWRYSLIFAGGLLILVPLFICFEAVISDWLFGRSARSVAAIIVNVDFFTVFFVTIIYFMLFFACLGLSYFQRWRQMQDNAAELEKKNVQSQLDLSNMRMQILQSQLSPHFLFNALGSISALARNAPRSEVTKAIRILGDMLRYTLGASQKSLISVGSEIQFTENYTALQKLRFADRCNVQLYYNNVPEHIACPPFVLQTLIENAFIHAVESREEKTDVAAYIKCDDQQLMIRVENDMAEPTDVKNGLGLALDNLGRRLSLMFSGQAQISGEMIGHKYVATITLPLTNEDL